jgi:hypothetical protein
MLFGTLLMEALRDRVTQTSKVEKGTNLGYFKVVNYTNQIS